MREYEAIFVLAPTLDEEQTQAIIDSLRQAAEERQAEVANVDRWGRRRLAFPVKKHTDGQYVIFTLLSDSNDALRELERRVKVSDSIIRFLAIRVDLERKRAEGRKRKKERRKPEPETPEPARGSASQEASHA
jgi:small subunit ribosomal protein S6